jgi:hypothetical protein
MKIVRVTLVFLLVLSLPVMAAEKRASVQDKREVSTAVLQLLLNSFASLGEGHIEAVLRGLKLISSTEEAQSGEWGKMRGLLAEFAGSGIKAAAVWFVRPDGSYFTAEKGLTGLNLSDRAYFPGLMAGREVTGDLVLSRSTGRRSAVVAVPVKKNGKIIGAVGVSLSIREISRMIDEEMGLPEDMILYALDQEGRASLHRVSAMLFAYPSDLGSRSVAKTVKEMLARPEGVVTYDFYGERKVVFKKSPLTGWVFAVGIVTGKPGEPGAELSPILSELRRDITEELIRVDQALAGLAARLSEKGLRAAGTRKMLGDLCRSYPYAVDCAYVDREGRMMLIGPGKYAGFEGSDISAQEQVIRLRESKKPVLSNAFKAVEGFQAVDLEQPVISPHGEFEGSLSMLIRPESLFSHILTPALRGMPVEVFLMQPDGRILYDEDKEEVGRMLFEDPLYKPFPQLLALGTLIAREKTGSGSYDFRQKWSEKLVRKDAHWTTVGLHGTEWRLVVMHVRAGHTSSSDKDLVESEVVQYEEALRNLAENAGMKEALVSKDGATIREIFRNFYSEHEGLYSVQWLDADGTNRHGYPEENSMINIDMKSAKTPSAKPMLEALLEKKESAFSCPLFEGKTGAFFMVPVYEGRNYLGMIYTIRLKE